MKKIKTKSGSLFISPVPLIVELNHGFDLIWNLAYECAEYADIEQLFCKKIMCANIEDCGVPWDPTAFVRDLQTVVSCLQNDGKVLVHCAAGHGRTGMALACIKFCVDNYTVDGALHYSWNTCQGPETYEQDDFVRFVCNNFKDRGHEKEFRATRQGTPRLPF